MDLLLLLTFALSHSVLTTEVIQKKLLPTAAKMYARVVYVTISNVSLMVSLF